MTKTTVDATAPLLSGDIDPHAGLVYANQAASVDYASDLWPDFRIGRVSEESDVPHAVHPLWELEAGQERVLLRRPLAVLIEETDSECIVSNDSLRIWGIGDSKYPALEDFARTFIAVLDTYSGTPAEQLSIDASKYLDRVKALVERRETL